MDYRCEATSLEGFVQQLASNILPHGYWHYVTGRVPDGKDPRSVDAKLVAKYGVALSRQQRARRKIAGAANLHYLRYGRRWVLLATKGEHRFFAEEDGNIRDARKVPIVVGGYSLSVKRGGFLKKEEGEEPVADGRHRVRVQIAREHYRDVTGDFLAMSCHRSAEALAAALYTVPFEPYAPIRRQLLNILRRVNERRQVAGFEKVPTEALRYRRRIVKPFEPSLLGGDGTCLARVGETERLSPAGQGKGACGEAAGRS